MPTRTQLRNPRRRVQPIDDRFAAKYFQRVSQPLCACSRDVLRAARPFRPRRRSENAPVRWCLHGRGRRRFRVRHRLPPRRMDKALRQPDIAGCHRHPAAVERVFPTSRRDAASRACPFRPLRFRADHRRHAAFAERLETRSRYSDTKV